MFKMILELNKEIRSTHKLTLFGRRCFGFRLLRFMDFMSSIRDEFRSVFGTFRVTNHCLKLSESQNMIGQVFLLFFVLIFQRQKYERKNSSNEKQKQNGGDFFRQLES